MAVRVVVVGPMEVLGHAVRIGLAGEAIAAAGYEVMLAGSDRYSTTLEALAPSTKLVPCTDIGAFLATRTGYQGTPLGDARMLMRNWSEIYRSNVSVLDDLRPDLLVTDTSPAAAAAARTLGIPVLATTNAVWCGFHDGLSAESRSHLGHACRVLGITLRRATPFDGEPAAAFLGDTTLIYDLHPNVDRLPVAWPDDSTIWIGPLFPKRADVDAPGSGVRSAFVTFGSTGDTSAADSVCDRLAAAGWNVRSPDRGDGSPDAGAHAREVARAGVVVTHGGSGSVYQAAYFGRPLVVVPSNVEHFANADRVVALGIGVRADADDVVAACEFALGGGLDAQRLSDMAAILRTADPLSVIVREVDRLVGSRAVLAEVSRGRAD